MSLNFRDDILEILSIFQRPDYAGFSQGIWPRRSSSDFASSRRDNENVSVKCTTVCCHITPTGKFGESSGRINQGEKKYIFFGFFSFPSQVVSLAVH
jgi:hypothetical protein